MCTRTVRVRGGCEKILFGENGSGIPSERHRLLVDHLCMTDNMGKSCVQPDTSFLIIVVLSSGLPPQIIGARSNWFERMGKVGLTVEEVILLFIYPQFRFDTTPTLHDTYVR